MKKLVFIISGGEIADRRFLSEKIADCRPLQIVCADKGARHLQYLGVTPDMIIGDMDSLSPDLQESFRQGGVKIVTHPARKNETDTQLALEFALGLDPEEVWIFGASGGRIDHTLANISLLALGVVRGVAIRLVDEWCEVFIVSGSHKIEGEPGQTVSLFPFSGAAAGITLTGFEYPLDDARMEPGRPYGISNRLATARGTISVRSGHLLVVRYFRVETFPGEH